jgi:hypothetical protein
MPKCARVVLFGVRAKMGGNGPHATLGPFVMPSWEPRSHGLVTELPQHGDSGAKHRGIIVCQLLGIFNEEVAPERMNHRWRSNRHVGMEQRRALQLPAGSDIATTETVMLTHHGFKRRTLANLLHAGLATMERASVNTEGKAIATGRIRITAAGRSALED